MYIRARRSRRRWRRRRRAPTGIDFHLFLLSRIVITIIRPKFIAALIFRGAVTLAIVKHERIVYMKNGPENISVYYYHYNNLFLYCSSYSICVRARVSNCAICIERAWQSTIHDIMVIIRTKRKNDTLYKKYTHSAVYCAHTTCVRAHVVRPYK